MNLNRPVNQLELGFHRASCPPQRLQRLRPHRARWWFGQMRQVVNNALDWQPTLVPPPQQTSLGLPHTNRWPRH